MPGVTTDSMFGPSRPATRAQLIDWLNNDMRLNHVYDQLEKEHLVIVVEDRTYRKRYNLLYRPADVLRHRWELELIVPWKMSGRQSPSP